jgi:hypothetical protein
MLRYLNNMEKIEDVNLSEEEFHRIEYYINREERQWKSRREKFLRRQNQPEEIKEA